MRKRNRWGLLVGLALVGAAIASELQKPPAERTWQGRIAGIIPYDLRPPTFERFRQAWWSPADRRILKETPFGVGWTVNLGRVARIAADAGTRLQAVD